MGMKLVFTSFRDSIHLQGLKVSIEKSTPRLCSYPVLSYLVMPTIGKSIDTTNMERICTIVLNNNWCLIQDFISEIHLLGIDQIVFCDWCTKEQIVHGKFCPAGIIGNYIQGCKNTEFAFSIEIEYGDGREVL